MNFGRALFSSGSSGKAVAQLIAYVEANSSGLLTKYFEKRGFYQWSSLNR